MKRIASVGLAGLITVALVLALFAYWITSAPTGPVLVVTDGSIIGTIEGNFTNYTDTNKPLVRDFNATTYANQTGGPPSVLALRLHTDTNYNGAQGWTDVYVTVTVLGTFASDLHLSELSLVCNQTGEWAEAWPKPGAVNITNGASLSQPVQFTTGTGTLTSTLVNQTGIGPLYEFVFPLTIHEVAALAFKAVLGIRATVTGRFAPAVGVAILLQIIDVPGG